MPTLYTISQLAAHFKLSRSTLLYYDKINLLHPSHRSENNYRYYTESDFQSLQKICSLREVGIPLKKIASIIKHKDSTLTHLLNHRLNEINDEIHQLREHQRMIVALLGNPKLLQTTRSMNKAAWIQLLKSTGLTEEGMHKWHQEFEKQAPLAHKDFLESLGLSATEVKKIRLNSKR